MAATVCRDALKAWEQKHQVKAHEATEVNLMCQFPPIEKMDESLNTLEAVEHLCLSNNAIERIIPLPKLANLRVLSLGRNCIKRIQGLEDVGRTLEELWLNYNQIERIDGLGPCVKLQMLMLSNNRLRQWEDINILATLPELRSVILQGNPIYEERERDENHTVVLKRVPQIEQIDGVMVSSQIRKDAEDFYEEQMNSQLMNDDFN